MLSREPSPLPNVSFLEDEEDEAQTDFEEDDDIEYDDADDEDVEFEDEYEEYEEEFEDEDEPRRTRRPSEWD